MKKVILSVLVVFFFVQGVWGQNNDDILIVDSDGVTIQNILIDIILDVEVSFYKPLIIRDTIFPHFSVSHLSYDYELGSWLTNNETYVLLRSNNIILFFHPRQEDREARKFMLELNGQQYVNEKIVTLAGVLYSGSGDLRYFYAITELIIDGKKYYGDLPRGGL